MIRVSRSSQVMMAHQRCGEEDAEAILSNLKMEARLLSWHFWVGVGKRMKKVCIYIDVSSIGQPTRNTGNSMDLIRTRCALNKFAMTDPVQSTPVSGFRQSPWNSLITNIRWHDFRFSYLTSPSSTPLMGNKLLKWNGLGISIFVLCGANKWMVQWIVLPLSDLVFRGCHKYCSSND